MKLKYNLFLIQVWLVQMISAEIPNPTLDKLHYQCNLNDEEFWSAYTWNFRSSEEIHMIKIITNYSKNYIDEFVTEMMKSYSNSQVNTRFSIYIKKYRLWYPFTPILSKKYVVIKCKQAQLINNYTAVDYHTSQQEEILSKRIRSFSADLNDAFHIVVWDVEDFSQFIVQKVRKIFPNPRGIYMVAFISPYQVKSLTLYKIFKKIWEDFGVLNIMFHMPCSCNKKNLFMFDPFQRVNNSWGILKKFQMKHVNKFPDKYSNSLKTLNGYPLKIALFERLPTVTKPPKSITDSRLYKNLTLSHGYCGLDAMLMATLAKEMNFQPILTSREDDYGSIQNGTYRGSIADVIYRRVDVSFNTRFVDGFGENVVENLTPVINDKFCLVVPKAHRIPQWLSIFRCFDVTTWFLIFFSYIICSVYWFNVRPDKIYSRGFDSFLDIFAIFISVPIHYINTYKHRIFLVACMIFNIIIVGSFQGQLITSFSTHTYYPDINTLQDFEKSGLQVITKSVGQIFGDDGSKLIRELNKRIITSNKSQVIKSIAKGKQVATFERLIDAELRIILYEGKGTVHICEECPKSYYYTYIVPKGSPYVHVFNIMITMFRETGLVMKWNNDVTDALIIEKRVHEKFIDNDVKQFSLSNLQISFYLLISGWFISFTVFLFEMYLIKNVL